MTGTGTAIAPGQSTARLALDAHAELCELLAHPSAPLLRHFDQYLEMGREAVALERRSPSPNLTADERAVLGGWDYYTWPATTGGELIGLLGEPLPDAPTYEVTPEVVTAITGMYRTTANGEPILRASEMPSRTGFAWLGEPVTLADFADDVVTMRALSWSPQRFAPSGLEPVNGVRVTTWAEDGPAAIRAGSGIGSSSSVFVPFGQPVSTEVSDDPTRWLHCLWLFMDTEITETERGHPDRHSRRRAARAGIADDITVIMLRRRHYEGGGAHRDIDWSCRWIVQGHDRHLGSYEQLGFEHHHARAADRGQPCAVCGVRTTWVRTYIKGPDDRPLKDGGKVYRVAV